MSTKVTAPTSRADLIKELGSNVSLHALSLQVRLESGRETGINRATLARLRQAIGTKPGVVPNIWDSTIGLVPIGLQGRTDDPAPAEFAVHHAITLFAMHCQGKVTQAHRAGISLGVAVRNLSEHHTSEVTKESPGVRKRFNALLTAFDVDEAQYHLRGLISLLRAAGLSLDYGRLVTDLTDLWDPLRRDSVRLRWAREYRRASIKIEEDHELAKTRDQTEENTMEAKP